MPELTLSMPAHNACRHIRGAIESVLRQEAVEFELIVIDDGSTDATFDIVKSFDDPRIKLLRNDRPMGIACCRNLVLDQSRSPFIVHVGPEGMVLPGAFQKMLAACRRSPEIGMVHSYYFDIDEDGNMTRDSCRLKKAFFLEHLKPGVDYKRELLVYGDVTNHFRTYRRKVFETVGRFNENNEFDADYDMALRTADRFDIEIVPEYLYCHRGGQNDKAKSSIIKALRQWVRRFRQCRQLLKSNEVYFLKEEEYRLNRLLLLGLYYSSGLENVINVVKRLKNLHRILFSSLRTQIVNTLYYCIIIHLSWWPISLVRLKKKDQPFRSKRIAYYTWHFPILSQTFVHRELAALKKSGLPVEVIADSSEDLEIADENAKCLLADTRYLDPIDKTALRRYRRYFFLKNPLGYFNLLFFVLTRRYGEHKNVAEDRAVFSQAIYLAGVLSDKKIDHVHSPWSDRCAFVALLASRFLGISYSVQARAHDIHRKSYLCAFREKFENAAFVITNTWYNESYMKTLLGKDQWGKISVIHNGLDLDRFNPTGDNRNPSRQIRILCVARLIEQKGIVYLLRACRALRDKGYEFKCELVGGPEEPLYTNYFIELKKLYRRLRLEDCVFFLGTQAFTQVLEKFAQADIFILPSVIAQDGSRDITPNALIEAMAMKLPVISTTVTGIPEIVDDGVSGILVPPNDKNALTDAVIRLIQDPDLRKRLGENARKKVEERFDIRKNIAKYVDLFSGSGP